MGEITYRVATLGDLETLAGLRYDMQLDMADDPSPMARDVYIATYTIQMREEFIRGRALAWLAEDGGQAVAAVTLLWWVVPPSVEWPVRRRGQVSNVYTRPAYRRRGISRRLMELLLAAVRERGIQRLVLWASPMGEPLYKGLGFGPSRAMEMDFE
jgi:GNAT superfamily N-acetyltransferase